VRSARRVLAVYPTQADAQTAAWRWMGEVDGVQVERRPQRWPDRPWAVTARRRHPDSKERA
jgi:hypothetical protein